VTATVLENLNISVSFQINACSFFTNQKRESAEKIIIAEKIQLTS
jgi:hypothetical protein